MAPTKSSSYSSSFMGFEQTGIVGTGKGELPPVSLRGIWQMIQPTLSMTGTVGNGGSGPYKVTTYFAAPGLPSHTIYQPSLFSLPANYLLSVVLWGNGACAGWGRWFSRFLVEITSHGYFVIANGTPSIKGMLTRTKWTDMIDAMDWICLHAGKGEYAHVDVSRIAAMGQSCGGLQAYTASLDPRVTLTCIFNSGLLNPMNMMHFKQLHAPIGYFLGGETDIAFMNGERDYVNLPDKIPAVKLNLPVGHMGTYGAANGGRFAEAAATFLEWQMKGNEVAEGKFVERGSNVFAESGWDVSLKNWSK